MDNNSKTPRNTKPNCSWSRDDEAVLIRALRQAKDEGKWGDNNPKDVVWPICTDALKNSEMVSGGVPKVEKAIKS
jgi:hypothetical protein